MPSENVVRIILVTLTKKQPGGCFIMRVTGVEPARVCPLEPKSNASASSAIPAFALF